MIDRTAWPWNRDSPGADNNGVTGSIVSSRYLRSIILGAGSYIVAP